MLIYEINKISDSLYSIKEDITDNKFPILIYLVIGIEKAALIDTGLGTGNLKQVVESITKLPIVVLHSHSHGDHVGADPKFSEIYLNPKEYDHNDATKQRLKYIEAYLKDKPEVCTFVKENIVRSIKVNYKNIEDGDVIHLGGIKLQAISTPGHTLGSISYVNKEEQYAFTGDAIADIHWFDDKKSICIEGFLNTLIHFEEKVEGVEKIYAAHLPEAFTIDLVHDLQIAAKNIIAGSNDKIENADYQFLKHGDLYIQHYGGATIYYNKENIYYNKKKQIKQIRISFG